MAHRVQNSDRLYDALLFLLFFFPATLSAGGSTVTLPIKLDYPLLQRFLMAQLFNTPDGSRELLHDPSGCSQILLSNPRMAAKPPQLEILTEVKARLGAVAGR